MSWFLCTEGINTFTRLTIETFPLHLNLCIAFAFVDQMTVFVVVVVVPFLLSLFDCGASSFIFALLNKISCWFIGKSAVQGDAPSYNVNVRRIHHNTWHKSNSNGSNTFVDSIFSSLLHCNQKKTFLYISFLFEILCVCVQFFVLKNVTEFGFIDAE